MEWKLGVPVRIMRYRQSLKPSLVEWKLTIRAGYTPCKKPLETFLSGMETSLDTPRSFPDSSLETFLSGLDKELERSCPKNPRDTRKSSGKASEENLILKKRLPYSCTHTQTKTRPRGIVYIEGFYNPKRPRSANDNLPHDKKKDVFKNTPRPYHDSFTYPDLF